MNQDSKSQIIASVQTLLDTCHSEIEKHRMIHRPDRLNLACPVCGDSHKSNRKKRGNLYWDSLMYHCYNCGVHKPITDVFRDFNISLNSNTLLDVLDTIQDFKQSIPKEISVNDSLTEFKDLFDRSFTIDEVISTYNLIDVDLYSKSREFIDTRLLRSYQEKLYWSKKYKRVFVLNVVQDRVLSAQARSLNDNAWNKYITFDFIKMSNDMNKNSDLDESTLQRYNKMCGIFGFMLVDLTRTFTVFEGPIDSFFMNNSLGLCTALKNVEFLSSIPTSRFFFDNDKIGKRKALEYLKCGCTVFLWTKYLRDMGIDEDLVDIKDYNDVVKFAYINKRKEMILNIDKYFTNDKYCILDV